MRQASAGPWRVARAVAIGTFATLIPALALGSDSLPRLLWQGVVPLLPLVFLVHPGIWRNVCPLATLGTGRPG